MSAAHPILARLKSGRPVLLSADPEASLRARGVPLNGPAALGRLVREAPSTVREHHQHEIAAGVDVVCALTAETIPRALAQIGMPFRSAALTGSAVEYALDAVEHASRPVMVAGVLGTRTIAPTLADRMAEELGIHAARLGAAGCELILAVGFSARIPGASLARVARRAAIASAVAAEVPAWALIEFNADGFTLDGEASDDAVRSALDTGADLVLIEAPGPEASLAVLDRVHAALPNATLGVMLPASHDDEPADTPEAWAAAARRLVNSGARVIGGGTGTTARHLAALAALLRAGDRQAAWSRPA